MSDTGLVVFCKCVHRDFVPPVSRKALVAGLHQSGRKVVTVDDLCGLAARDGSLLTGWAQSPQLTVIACYPRAARWLFAMAGAPLAGDDTVQLLNPRTQSPREILAALGAGPTGEAPGPPDIIERGHDPEPWFPVIDGDRCRNCKLCFNFCLFGVYSVDDGDRVRVSQPDNCKNNCPACARVCPTRAIIFPKLDQSPINGDKVDEKVAAAPPGKLDRLDGADVYDLLRQRSSRTKRFSTEPRKPGGMLEILHRELDIPMDVLQALSPTDLARIHKKAALPREPHE